MSDTPPPLTPNPSADAAPPPSSGGGKKVAVGCGLGCLVLVILGIVAAVLIWGATKKAIEGGIANFTADQPVMIEPPQAAPDQVQDAISRFDAFKAAMEKGETPAPLELSDQDINVLIYNHPDFGWMEGKGRVDIEGDKLTSKVSVNLDELEIPVKFLADAVKGRYFNGEVTISLAMAAGRPTAFVEELVVNGQNPPEEFMAGIRQENLFKEAQSDPEMQKFFERISDLKIENDKLTIVPK